MKTKLIYTFLALFVFTLSNTMAQNEVFSNQINTKKTTITAVEEQPIFPNQSSRQVAAELINFQAVARDSDGNLIVDTAVTIDVEIRDGAGGSVVFSETHNPTTDEQGVFSIQIGSNNSIASINWLDIEAWLQVSLDGNDIGETRMGSVPTALHSRESGQVVLYGSGTTNDDKMIALHSPAFPGWGIGYSDNGDDITFMAGGTANASVDLATGNMSTDGYIEVTQTTSSPAANRIYGNSSAIAYGSIDSLGGISTGYGISSVNHSSTGFYEIVIDLDSNAANTVVSITPFTIGFGLPEICGYETTGPNTFTVRIQDVDGNPRDSAFTFIVYGN